MSPQGRQVEVQIRGVGSTTALETHTVTLSASGGFTLTSQLPRGQYDVAVKGSHWLRKVSSGVLFNAFGAAELSFSLGNGDVTGDNTVSLADFAQLRSAFGSTVGSSNWNPEADLNGDGTVSLGDFAILRANFGQQGDA